MKLLNSSIAVLLLSLATLPSVSEAKLAPTTFVGKSKASFPNEASLSEVLGEPEQKHTHAHPNSKSKSLSTLSSLTRLAGGSAESLSPAFTYYLDVFLTLLVGGFTAIWFVSMQKFQADRDNYLDEFPNFNKQVMEKGFCLAKDKSTNLFGLETEKLCGIADLLLVVFSYFKYKDSFVEGDFQLWGGQIMTKEKFFMFSLFTLVHGAIHFSESNTSGKILGGGSLVESILVVGLLAAMSIFSRLGLMDTFEQAGKSGWDAIATGVWLSLVAAFAIGINEKAFALTFINVSTFLPVLAARVLLLKKDDERRLKGFYEGKTAMGPVIIAIIHLAVMFFEPLVCKAWFESVGGHLWFDVSLWFMLIRHMF
mmetsp:Transcript_28271/g.40399  ORF Transcript_28271/g.40399 Transcript_28271/m.40399 type:complete len:367 (-) Transcript_28271:111-1211(-)|eukprot:CAMPEP_0201697820 /NCGR_PEP_ID=MMETSP0578-20130828/14274_1 /ASSEMBLY_ACC=CAM_ASM_000663 /TAXON_ID=267565 /ORGANISM="Skeletonema grethea, Strain CCMP 1804" /LENGTH=366 /DNA_ID=CAMNT_0048184155 /DNA_START=23 /DNA_END=1123 /DNA_ORIENTATION=-